MTAVHFRYGWISQHRLRHLFSISLELERIATLLLNRETILARRTDLDRIAGVADDLVRWVERPKWSERPTQRRLRQARHRLGSDTNGIANELLLWISQVLALFDQPERKVALTHQRISFLDNLARTDFPALLLWRNSHLAKRLFRNEGGAVTLQSQITRNSRHLLRAIQICLTFALAGASRLSPRDGWVGVGFSHKSRSAAAAVQISRHTERFTIEPDIAWINRNWPDFPPYPLEPGMSAWSYAFKKASGVSLIAKQRTQILQTLKNKCDEIQTNIYDFDAVSSFLDETEIIWRQTMSEDIWAVDSHRWWIIRYLPKEVIIPDRLNHLIYSAYNSVRSNLLSQKIIRNTPCPDKNLRQLHYSARIKTRLPEAVYISGDEAFDSVIDIAAVQKFSLLHAYLPERHDDDAVPVGKIDERGLQFLFFDPSPRRSAERFAILFNPAPSFCTSQHRARALRPSQNCVDNRLVRLSAEEVAINEVSANEPVEFRSALVTSETAPLVAMETASYVLRDLPDLIPVFTDSTEQHSLSFGFLDHINRVWLLTKEEANDLVNSARTADILALIYHLEVHQEFGNPIWVDVIVDGKRTSMPTHSIVAFDMLLHFLRTVSSTVAVHATLAIPAEPIIVDEEKQGIATIVFSRR